MKRNKFRKYSVLIDCTSARRGGGVTFAQKLYSNYRIDDSVLFLVSVPIFSGNNVININSRYHSYFIFRLFKPIILKIIVQKHEIGHLFFPGGSDVVRIAGTSVTTMFRNMLPFCDFKSPNVTYTFKKRIKRYLIVRSAKKSDRIIYIADHARINLEKFVKKPYKLFPHTNLINHNIHRESESRYDFIYVSNSAPYKGHGKLIRALEESESTKFLKGKSFIFVGKIDDKTKADLNSLKSFDLIIEIIDVHISRNMVMELMARSKYGIFLSECENCPNTFIEMCELGLPIIALRHAWTEEFANGSISFCSWTDVVDKMVELKFNEYKSNIEYEFDEILEFVKEKG